MEDSGQVQFRLPGRLDGLMAVLAEDYDRKGNGLMRGLLAESDHGVDEGYEYDNWGDGGYGHAVHLKVPRDIYFDVIDNLANTEEEIRSRLNEIARIPREWASQVTVELKDPAELVIKQRTTVRRAGAAPRQTPGSSPVESPTPPEVYDNVWRSPGFLRVFLSHIADHKSQAADLKNELAEYGVICFVAHSDIEPIDEWQEEIEKALFSMEALVALLTPGFHDSNWTDQEVGVAIGRKVPAIPVRLGRDPYGFIGKYQGVPGSGKEASALAKGVFDILFTRFQSLKPRVTEALVARFEAATSFSHAKRLMAYLTKIESATPELVSRLEQAPKSNPQVRGAWAVDEALPGLVDRLRSGASV